MKRAKTIRKNSRLPVFAALLFLLQSCSSNIIHNHYQAVEGAEWDKNVEYYFTFNIEDISIPYNVIFEVRNNNFYSYRNLWIFYSEESPAAPLRRDTVEFFVADNYGKWTGKGLSLHESSFTILKDYYFPIKGQYSFCFRHGMRIDRLQGIQEIGLRIEKSAPQFQ